MNLDNHVMARKVVPFSHLHVEILIPKDDDSRRWGFGEEQKS